MSRAKPRNEANIVRLERIREILNLSKSEFSLAIGFQTTGGYDAAIRMTPSNQLVLAAEGLLAQKASPSEVMEWKMLLTINSMAEVVATPIRDTTIATILGREYMLIPLNSVIK